jgi:hypothetical protein
MPLAVRGSGVVTNCTEANLRAAMSGGGLVTFACDGTITLADSITNATDTILDARGRQVTISGGNAVRVFYVNTNTALTLANLSIADGKSFGGSAVLNLGGMLNLNGVSFRSNSATIGLTNDAFYPRAGGGVIFNRGGAVNATNCSFTGNSAQTTEAIDHSSALVNGGAIRNEAGQVNLRSCAFVGNRAFGGAANSISLIGDPGSGGAIHNSGTATLDLCTLVDNATTAGGAFGPTGGVGHSGSDGSGGAIWNQGTLTVNRTTFSGNSATGGSGAVGASGESHGGIHTDGYTGGNGGGAKGAAICNSGVVWVTRSTFASNSVTGGTGGAGGMGGEFIDSGGTGGIGGNGGAGRGGTLFNSGAASLVSCTIAFDTGRGGAGGTGGMGGGWGLRWGGSGGAGGGGGSGFGGVDGTCNLTNCTIAWNLGIAGAGGAGGAGAPSSVHPGGAGTPGTSGTAWGGTVCSALVNTLIASNTPAGNDSFANPKLGPLGNYGGPTLTIALLPGSPAIDAGDNASAPPTDQRGIPRPVGSVADVGAYEFTAVLEISRTQENAINVLVYGPSGQSCRLLTSTNLADWQCVATNQIATDGTVLFEDNCGTGDTQRFYRVAIP